jgi:hypothetical protein
MSCESPVSSQLMMGWNEPQTSNSNSSGPASGRSILGKISRPGTGLLTKDSVFNTFSDAKNSL